MLKLHEDNYELDALVSHSRNSELVVEASDGLEGAIDVAAAFLLRQIEEGRAHLRIAMALLARRASDLDLAFAHLEATRRVLERVAFYVTNVELACESARGVIAARRQLSKQHRGALKQIRDLRKRHQQYVPALRECPALV